MKSINKFMMSVVMLLCVIFGISPQLVGQTGTVVYSTPGPVSFIQPPGVETFKVKLWGAGGGGGNTPGTDGQGGGGGGAFHKATVFQPGNQGGGWACTTVGAGGTAGNPGGATNFGCGLVSAAGGAGSNSGNGFGGAGGVQAAYPPTIQVPSSGAWNGGNGGASTNPIQTFFGGGGGGRADDGVTGGPGSNGGTSGGGAPGIGGITGGGNGGAIGAVGFNATSYGGGGGGRGQNGANSGTGGDGRIEISWDCPTLTSITYPSPTACSYSSALMPTVLPASALGGTYTSGTLGAFLNVATGAIAPGAPQGTHVISYGWPAYGGCPAASVSFTLTIAPQAVAVGLSYGSPLCSNSGNVSPTWTTLTGVAGTYSSTAGLNINATTGVINANASTPGTYTVTYTVAASGNCNAVTATATVTITALPTITNFDYPPAGAGNNNYCTSAGTQSPTSTVTNPNNNAISYSALPSGLTLNATTGVITPSSSTPGTYTVTMTIAAGAGCAAVTANTTVTILALPTAAIAYTGNPFCQTVGSTSQSISVTSITGGPLTSPNFSATPAGLTINSTTGTIDLNSNPGTYTVTYSFTGANGCTNTATTSVTIKARPTSTISYSGPNPICSNINPVVGGNITAVGAWTLTLSNGQTATGTGSGTWSIAINTMNPGDVATFTVSALIDANNCPAAAIDRPGSVTITKRTITSGTIPSASNTRVCEGQDASINVVLTSSANCAPTPRFSGVFAIEYFDGSGWQPHPTNPTFAWTSNAGASTTGTNTAVTIPASILNNPNSYTLQYRISWVSLTDCNGCSADPLTGSVIVEIVPNPLLVVSAAPTGDICPGTILSFNVSQAANSYVLPQHALFNWVATIPNGSGVTVIAQGQNTSLGNISFASPSCPFNGIVTIKFTPLNTSCCNCLYTPIYRYVTVRDIIAPTWTTTAGSLNRTLECSDAAGLATAQALFPVATDNCDSDVSNIIKVSGQFVASQTCPQAGTYTNTWTVKDDCGNTSAVFTQVITIQDTQAPTWTTAAGSLNRTLECSDAAGLVTAQALFPVAMDNCDANVTNIVKVSGVFVASQTCPQAGTYTNTWTVKDDCGNTSAVFTQVITIQDTQAPIWNTAAGSLNRTLECSDAGGLTAAQALFPVAMDNCDANVTNIVKVSGAFVASQTCPQAGTYTNTWTVKDDCGNTSAVFTQVITIQDTQAPTWNTAAGSLNRTLECSDVGGLTAAQALFPVAMDNCDANVTNIVKVSGAFVASQTCPQAGTYTNTWTVKDDCGNTSAVFTQVITIQDTQAPTWTTAPTALNQTLQCSNTAGIAAAQALFPVAGDNCDANVTNIVKVSGAFVASQTCPQSGTYTNTWTVKDDCGNTSAVFTQVITVIDNTPPALTGVLPLGQTGINGCIGSAPAGPTAAAIAALYTDNCGTVVVTKTGAPTGTNCNWTAAYTYTIADNCGNALPSITITYSGSDQSAPVITNVVPTQTLNTGAGVNCGVPMPDYRSLVNATDCGSFTLTQLAPNAPGTMVFGFNGYRDIVIEAKDACGNISTTTFQVFLKDLTPPTAICKPYTVILNANGTGSITVSNVNNGSFDNCTPTAQLVYGLSQTNFTCANVGTNNVTLSVTDLCGNVSTCTAVVTVVDNTPPVITCWGDTTINKDANCTYTMPDLTFRVNKSDACGIASVTQSIPVGSIFGASITQLTMTLTVTDVNGNASTCNFKINFVDVTPPVISGCPANVTVNTGLGNTTCSQVATWTPPTATDACIHLATQTVTLSSNYNPGATFPVGVTTVTYTAVDLSGNTSTCSFTVTVVDNTKPIVANCPANVSVNTGAGATACNAAATWTEPTATDNCTAAGNLVRTRSHAPGSTFPVGTTTVTYTFTDAAGNVSNVCSFNVTVTDNTAPIVTCPSNITAVPNALGCVANVVNPNPTYSDNCSVTKLTWAATGVTTLSSPATGINFVGTKTFNVGVTTVTYTATDAAGNTATCTYTVTINKPLAGAIGGTSTVLQNVSNTSTVSFSAQGGTAPYTFVYTTTAGGFPSAGTHTIVTTGTNSSTVGGNPNHLITTVPQSNATPGTYTYTLTSVTDAYGCNITPNTTAVVTVVGFNHPRPDLTPTVPSPLNANFVQSQQKEGFIKIENVVANPTSGIAEFRVFVPANYTLDIDGSTLISASNAVNNTDFDITLAGSGIFYTVKSKPGVTIGANSTIKIGYKLTSNGSSNNIGLMTVSVLNGTGGVATVVGDSNNNNNQSIKVFTIN
jgi:hypothetical protein